MDPTPALTTDKPDYAPGDVVTITGTGFQPLEPVTLVLQEEGADSCPDRTFTSYADGEGDFTNTEFSPEERDIGARFTLTATGQWSGLTATTTFTDATPTRIRSNSMSPNSGACGSNITAQATLEKRVGNPPNASFVGFGTGATITFTLRNASNVVLATGAGATNGLGTAAAVLTVPTGATQLAASYAGDNIFNPVDTSIPFAVTTVCDNVAPTVAAAGAANPGALAYASGSYTNKNYVTVSLSATDNPGGAGVQSITYSAAGATTLAPFTFTGSSTSFDIFNEGETIITYSARDNANNASAPQTFVVRIDRTAPSVNCGSADGLWHPDNVTIPCTASDGGSGLANAGDASFDLSTSVASGDESASAQTDGRQVCDSAGNCADAGPISGNMIDRKGPVIIITTPAAGGTYVLNQTVASGYTATDGGSGLASSTPASGLNINTAAVGPKTFNVTATDNVGNVSTGAAGYSVAYAPAGVLCPLGPGRTILQPINADGSSVFKQGSTVPAKFRVYDANCNSIGTPGVVADFRLVQVITGTVTSAVNETVVSTAADPLYRWSASDQQWIFNTNTKGLAANSTYVFRITLNDGTDIDFRYGLK